MCACIITPCRFVFCTPFILLCLVFPTPPLDNIWAMMIDCLDDKSVDYQNSELCCIVYTVNYKHTYTHIHAVIISTVLIYRWTVAPDGSLCVVLVTMPSLLLLALVFLCMFSWLLRVWLWILVQSISCQESSLNDLLCDIKYCNAQSVCA